MDFRHLLEQAQNFQKHLAQIDTDLEGTELTGSAGGGAVSATVDGLGRLKALTLDPDLLATGDAGLIGQTITTAVVAAQEQAIARREEQRTRLLGELQLPDL